MVIAAIHNCRPPHPKHAESFSASWHIGLAPICAHQVLIPGITTRIPP